MLSLFSACVSDKEEITTDQKNENSTESTSIDSEIKGNENTEGLSSDDGYSEDVTEYASEVESKTDDGDQNVTESNSEQESTFETETATEIATEMATEMAPEVQVRNEIEQRYFIFRIWNFDILSIDEFKSTVDRVVLDGFNAIKIQSP